MRIVFTTFGSFGDIHPYIPIMQQLRERGQTPVMATLSYYRERFEALGFEFHAIRPDVPAPADNPELMRRGMDALDGPRVVLQEMLMPHLRDSYADLSDAVRGADLLVSHPITFAAPLLAEKTGVRWISTTLSPSTFFSNHDPMRPMVKGYWDFMRWHPLVAQAVMGLVKFRTGGWLKIVAEFRRELGLPPGRHPLFEAQHAPARVLALFSSVLGQPQPDWPPQTRITGFPFYDLRDDKPLDLELIKFLDAGAPPIIFTLGSAAVWDAGDFYRESVKTAQVLGRRALLLIGEDPRNQFTEPLPAGSAAFAYAPYSQVFPRAAAVVHQGGIGTTGQTLRAGIPALFVPFGHDQPDNAFRTKRLGMARVIARDAYRADRVAVELRELLTNPNYAQNAAEIGRRVRAEDGTTAACDEIVAILRNK